MSQNRKTATPSQKSRVRITKVLHVQLPAGGGLRRRCFWEFDAEHSIYLLLNLDGIITSNTAMAAHALGCQIYYPIRAGFDQEVDGEDD